MTRTRSADGTLSEEFDFGARKVSGREGSLAAIILRPAAISDELSLGATLVEPDSADTGAAGFRQAVGRARSASWSSRAIERSARADSPGKAALPTRAARESSDGTSGIATTSVARCR